MAAVWILASRALKNPASRLAIFAQLILALSITPLVMCAYRLVRFSTCASVMDALAIWAWAMEAMSAARLTI